jgi:hypothetical protein
MLSTSALERERIVVPPFQRGYMWKKKHVVAFWEDVNKQRISTAGNKGADPHFFGPIVTMAKPENGVIYLLDGQQRLATATILFSVLRDIGREISKNTGAKAGHDFLRGHLKSGQWWSLQNRPTERGLGLGCFTPLPPEKASLFLCANSVDRI